MVVAEIAGFLQAEEVDDHAMPFLAARHAADRGGRAIADLTSTRESYAATPCGTGIATFNACPRSTGALLEHLNPPASRSKRPPPIAAAA